MKDRRKRYHVPGIGEFLYLPDDPARPRNAILIEEAEPKGTAKKKQAPKPKNKAVQPGTK